MKPQSRVFGPVLIVCIAAIKLLRDFIESRIVVDYLVMGIGGNSYEVV